MDLWSKIIWIVVLLCFISGAVIPFGLNKDRILALKIGCIMAAAGSGSALLLGVKGFLGDKPIDINLGNILPSVDLAFQVDHLSGFFLLTIAIVAFVASLYSITYMQVYVEENMGWWSFCYNIFLLSMMFVVTVNNVITFLIFWELMSVSSYFLVTFSFKRERVRKAGFVYLVMTHIGTVFIASAFFLLVGTTGGWSFTNLALQAEGLELTVKNLIFLCVLLGFGTKAGMVPVHVWLPKAHPAAPTNISALMSGVMLKTAIYGMIRVLLDILGIGPSWWGVTILCLGLLSAFVGVVSALMEKDLKRLLAYSSVENIGIILMGIGTSFVFYSWSLPIPAAIALAAGLFHVFNHAIFKSLLFLSTGSVYYATKTKDMGKLGGLINKMPQTAMLFLIGSIAISALPPLSGFASEYQLYLSLLSISQEQVSSIWIIGGILACALLALIGALAAACFVKAFGITFLALPRSPKAEKAVEVPWKLTASMAPLALLCLLFGLLPGPMMRSLAQIGVQITQDSQLISIETYHSGIFIALAVVISVVIGITYLINPGKVRKVPTWGCGINTSGAMQYTADSFSQPVRRVYQVILRPTRKVKVEFTDKAYFGYRITFRERIGPKVKDYVYKPLRQYIVLASKKWQAIQSGNINLYLGYIFITLIILLILITKG